MSVDFIIEQEEKEIAGHTTDKEYIWDHSFLGEGWTIPVPKNNSRVLTNHIIMLKKILSLRYVCRCSERKAPLLWDFKKSAGFHGFFWGVPTNLFQLPKNVVPWRPITPKKKEKKEKQYVGNCSRKEKKG